MPEVALTRNGTAPYCKNAQEERSCEVFSKATESLVIEPSLKLLAYLIWALPTLHVTVHFNLQLRTLRFRGVKKKLAIKLKRLSPGLSDGIQAQVCLMVYL